MSLRRLALAVLVSVAAVVPITGCSPWWAEDQPGFAKIGVAMSDGGRIVILYEHCQGEAVTAVDLDLLDQRSINTVRTLWSIEANGGGSRIREYTVGEAPSGFRTVTKLNRQLGSADHLSASITSSVSGMIPINFEMGKLRERQVYTSDGFKSRSEFLSDAKHACS